MYAMIHGIDVENTDLDLAAGRSGSGWCGGSGGRRFEEKGGDQAQ
jgi:hypothetical protein